MKSLRQSEPMDYTADPPLRVRRVDQSHLNENFVQYVLDDILGQVDNAHLAWSDRISPYSEVCLELSKIHSTAVDFAKTGIAALFDGDLRVRDWPDFMDEVKGPSNCRNNAECCRTTPKDGSTRARRFWASFSAPCVDRPLEGRLPTYTVAGPDRDPLQAK